MRRSLPLRVLRELTICSYHEKETCELQNASPEMQNAKDDGSVTETGDEAFALLQRCTEAVRGEGRFAAVPEPRSLEPDDGRS